MKSLEAAKPKTLLNAEIDVHPLLTREQRTMLKAMRSADRQITMYDFACVVLKATACDYSQSDDDDVKERVKTERALKYAAILFVYEALKACDHDIIKQWPEFETMLQQIEDLNTLGLPL